MKKLIIILIFFIPAALFANDARVERWQSRIDRIINYREKAAKLPFYSKEAEKLFNYEIKSSEEFISILNRYSTGDGTVKAEPRKYTVEEIEQITSNLADPFVTLYYMSEMIKDYGNPAVKSAVKEDVNRYALKKGLPPLKMASREAETLARKYIMQKYLTGYEKSKKKALADILGITEYELSRTGYNSNEIDLAEIIIRASEKISSQGINKETPLDEACLTSLSEWKEIEKEAGTINRRTDAAAAFSEKQGIPVSAETRKGGVNLISTQIFSPWRNSLKDICGNTAKTPPAGYNNPLYEIPDFKRIQTAVDDIDGYRNRLISSMNGSEGKGFINKVRKNNSGLAWRQLRLYEKLFQREKMRISSLKESSSGVIIYNEEIFKAAEKHFADIKEKLLFYSDLSSDFIEALYNSWRIDPDEFLAVYRLKTSKNIDTVSFIERLTSEAIPAGKAGNAGINSLYHACTRELFIMMRDLYTGEKIPVEVRSTMTAEQVRAFAGINGELRVKGKALAVSARKNLELFSGEYNKAVASRKESIIASERNLGQDEVDRLFSCATKYAEYISAMDYTAQSLKNYSDEYKKITGDIENGNDLSRYLDKINSGSLIPLVPGFSPEQIESELKLRDMLAREGNESLSGAVALMQYYSRRGYRLKFVYTPEEIQAVKEKFTGTPEVQISSWKMNGRNYRFIDANAAEKLKKLINRKAWHQDLKAGADGEKEKFSPDGNFNFSISLPEGWKRTLNTERAGSITLSLQSPDLLGAIMLQTEKYENGTLKDFSNGWQKKNGFTPVAKEWGKTNGIDYLVTVSKNSFDRVMESYMIKKGKYIIIISGTTERNRYSSMSRNLKGIFSSLELSDLPVLSQN